VTQPGATPENDHSAPILLFNDECGVCRAIANWVRKSIGNDSNDVRLVVRPIGDDPAVCRSLNPKLDIWDAYATIHLLMPDGSMKLGGEAVADVLRALPNTRWFAWTFNLSVFGFRPFQMLLDAAYAILSDVRPLFGCESCGTLSVWWKPIEWLITSTKKIFGKHRPATPHFTRASTLAKVPVFAG
jgi:predicted DCC family thiol-disulfide oxidoreductase YuxK